MTNNGHRKAPVRPRRTHAARNEKQGPGNKKQGPRPAAADPSGLEARHLAIEVLSTIISKSQTLDEVLATTFAKKRWAKLAPRDRALARLITTTVLRRFGELSGVVNAFLAKPLPAKNARAKMILRAGAAQILMLDTPPHAAINLSVELVRKDRRGAHLDKLVNAVLRRVAREGHERLSQLDPIAENMPAWLLERWQQVYGNDVARRIAEASLTEPPLDITAKQDSAAWAEKLGGVVLPTGSIRIESQGRIDQLPGFAEGAWWVQDAAAALPARLLGDVKGAHVADLCAAPGGKTAQLAAMGAHVTAVDLKTERLARLEENLKRLSLNAECVAADVTTWSPGRAFDAVLLDAPCTATGTIRRHPDILHLKRPADLAALLPVQQALLAAAARLVKPGGRLVYCTCSLEPEEGEAHIATFLAAHPDFTRDPVTADEIGVEPQSVTPVGELRTLPFHMSGTRAQVGGCDGFFAARLKRRPN